MSNNGKTPSAVLRIPGTPPGYRALYADEVARVRQFQADFQVAELKIAKAQEALARLRAEQKVLEYEIAELAKAAQALNDGEGKAIDRDLQIGPGRNRLIQVGPRFYCRLPGSESGAEPDAPEPPAPASGSPESADLSKEFADPGINVTISQPPTPTPPISPEAP